MKVEKIASRTSLLVVIGVVSCMFSLCMHADDDLDIYPIVICEYQDSSLNVITDTAAFGSKVYCEAPVKVICTGNVNYDEEKYTSCICEWKIFDEKKGSSSPIIDRFEEDIDYTITSTGTYCVTFAYTLIDKAGMTYSVLTDSAVITIKESELECPDGFSPNGDEYNEKFKMTKFQSIVKLEGEIYNRWGQVLHTFTLDNIRDGWDGRYKGKVVKDGGYILRIHAIGSEGREYNIKKVINVLKGFREESESE